MGAPQLDTTSERPRRLWQSASQGLLVLWIWGLSSLALLVMYGDAKQQAYQWADSLTAVMSRQIKAQAESLEKRLLAQANVLSKIISEQGSGTEPLFLALRPTQLADPALSFLFIVDSHGDLIASSRSTQPPKLNLGGSDFFEAHRRQVLNGIFVSHLPKSPFAHDLGQSSMVYSVRLQNEQGELLGVLVALVNAQPIISMYRSFQLSNKGEARLLGGDGRQLLSDKAHEGSPQRLKLGLLHPDTDWRGGYVGKIGNDEQPRFYVLRHIPEYNLITLVGLDQQHHLARWYQFLLFGGLTLLAMTSYIALQWRRQQVLWQRQDQSHEQLLEAERKIAGLLDSVPDAVWSMSPDHSRLRYLSPSAAQIYGFSHAEFLAQPDKWMERIVEDERQQVTHALAETQFASGEQFEQIYRIRVGNATRWIKHRAWGVQNGQGVLLSIDSLASDVSEQINSLHSLQEREQELQALLDGMPLGAMFFKNNHCYANPAAAELLGARLTPALTPAELFGLLRPAHRQQGIEVSIQGQTPFTCTLLEHGKPIRFLRVSWQFVARGNLWLLQDVTDSERQARLSAEVEAAANVGGWELDLRNKTLLWSPQMYRLHGTDPQHFTPSTHNMFELFTDESARQLREAGEQALLAGGEFSLDLDLRRTDDTPCNVHLVAKVQWHEGQPIRWYGSLQDITEREQATRALAHQTQILSAAEHIAGMGSWEWQPQTDHIAWSQGARSLHSLLAADMGSGVLTWIERVHPDERAKMSAMLEQARSSQAPLSWNYHALDATLQWREIVVNTLPDLDEQGQVRVVRGTLHDVTETRALHAALQLRNRAIESLSSGVVIIDVGSDAQPIIYASPAMSVISGYAVDELLQQNPRLLFGTDRKQAEIGIMEQAIRQRQAIQLTLRSYRKDGSMFWNEIGLAPVAGDDGQIRHYIGIMTDVTARRRSEEMLLEMQQRLRSILDTAADAIVVIDQKGRIQLFSHAAEKIFGYTADEVLGHNVSILMPEPFASEHDHYISRYVTANQPKVLGFGRELNGCRKDGTLVPIELAVSDWRSGDEMFFTGVIRDVTEQRKLQEQLLQSQKLDALGQLAGGIAHDFNNLLGVVVGNLDILAALLAEQPANLKRVNTALQAAERGASLTKRLLAFARTGATITEKVPVMDLNQIIRDVVDLIGKPLDPRIEFTLALSAETLPVRVDPAELQNALLNLVLNARDAMPEGGYLGVETSSVTIYENQPDLPAGKYAQISVSDSGKGIEAAERKRIFEPFYTTKPKGKGTGLGLSMVYSFVKRQQGSIRLDSEPGKGTTFELLFPYVTAVTESRSAEAKPHNGRGKLVLLVDDEQSLLATVADQLQSLGYRTVCEHDPEQALHLLQRRNDFDLLFSDILMPRLSGTELARHARNLHPNLPILLATGFPDQYRTDELLNLPQVRLLAKPVARAKLIDALEQLLTSDSAPPA